MSQIIGYHIFGEFFDEIFKLDSKIRFVASYDGSYRAKYQKGFRDQIEEEVKQSLSEAHSRWNSKNESSFKFSKPSYYLQNQNVKRVTIPLSDDKLVMISTDLDADIPYLVERILDLMILKI